MDIDELLKRPRDCFINSAHPAMEDPGHWCVGPVILTRDSGLRERANATSLKAHLKSTPGIQGSWEIHTFNHWAVGWVEHLSFKVLKKGPGKKTTKVYEVIKDWFDGLSDYPVADEELLSQMKYDAAIEAIISQGSRWLKEPIPEEWASEVWTWLWNNDPSELEDPDGNGAYPSVESVREALRSLGIHEEEEEEEEEKE